MDALNNVKDLRELLVRKPFYEVTPKGYMKHGLIDREFSENEDPCMPADVLYRNIKTQQDFLREFYPSGHRICDPQQYPDIWKKNPETGLWCVQKIQRTAFAFQQVIWTKHVLHVTGNDIQFELAEGTEEGSEDKLQELLTKYRKGWLMHDMEIRFFEAVSAYMKVADCAIVGYFDGDGKFGTRTLSFDSGDTLFPRYDPLTGELIAFARKYVDYDEEGEERIEWVEAWDKDKFYRLKKDLSGGTAKNVVRKIASIFGASEYACVEEKRHGFPFIPVAYARNEDGPCWSAVQRNIEDYEEAFSYLCENNKAYAFPILTLTGEGDEIEIKGDTNGAAKTIMITDTDGKAEFLNGTDASNAFATQLNKSYDLIYELSFTVKPPELKSGDLPGVAIKLLYSPALEAAMNDAQRLQPFLDQLVRITKFGIGTENNCMASMVALPVNAWIESYIHQNDTELITNLATAVQNKFLSKQTASERNSKFSKNDEFTRIMREQKEEDQQDLLIDIQRQEAQVENNIEQEEALAKINKQQSGSDVNTGRGKRGRPRTVDTDHWGNRKDGSEQNWADWNSKH